MRSLDMIGTTLLTIAAATGTLASDTVTLEERIDLYEPSTGAYLGAERTWFGPDGRRLRLENTDAEGEPTLVFFLRHDDRGRESEGIYFEGEATEPVREVFTYSPDGRLQTTTYFYEPGVAADKTETERDAADRDIRKRYFRADGSQYGEEDVLWDDAGNQIGWDFRYVGRDGGTSFRYLYQEFDKDGHWIRRVRLRNETPERVEVRSRTVAAAETALHSHTPFASGSISSERSETSPSFSRDGQTMVFARYGDDWNRKEPFIAYLEEGAWRVERLTGLGTVYNLSISPDGGTIFFATNIDDTRTLFRVRRIQGAWSNPESLTERFGITGTYPSQAENGDLYIFDAEGDAGAGIYVAVRDGDGFRAPAPVYTPGSDAPFDGYTDDGRTLLVTRCFDDACASGSENGIWELRIHSGGAGEVRKLPGLPYAWGAQPVESLGLFIFTDGDDILAIPLARAGLKR